MRSIKTIFVFCFILAVGCTSRPEIKAIYYVKGSPLLSTEDLRAHPEIKIVTTFEELTQQVSEKTSVWIDSSVTPFTAEQQQWINAAPQAYVPIVLVGFHDTLYSFRDVLGVCCFEGPAILTPPEPTGFSIIQKQSSVDPTVPVVLFLEGYNQTPTAQTILTLTNALLEGKFSPTASETIIRVATPPLQP